MYTIYYMITCIISIVYIYISSYVQHIIYIQVSRLSWPPTNVTYYNEQILPSCDSKIAVYANQGNFTDGVDHSIACHVN